MLRLAQEQYGPLFVGPARAVAPGGYSLFPLRRYVPGFCSCQLNFNLQLSRAVDGAENDPNAGRILHNLWLFSR